MSIETIKNHLLSNTSHLKYFTAVRELIKKFNAERLKITAQFVIFSTCIDKEDLAFKVIRKSNLSTLKKKSDKARDTIVLGIKDALKSALRHFDEEVSEAAQRLKIVFDTYNNPKPIIGLPYDDETLVINNLLDEFEDKYASDVQKTGLSTWVEELRFRNDAFDRLATAYNEQQAEKPAVQAKEVRRETDKAYQDIITIISAFVIMEGEDSYAPFVNELNSLIKHYNSLVAQHHGRIQAGKEREKEEQEKAAAEKLNEKPKEEGNNEK
jgi:hypothetical protein